MVEECKFLRDYSALTVPSGDSYQLKVDSDFLEKREGYLVNEIKFIERLGSDDPYYQTRALQLENIRDLRSAANPQERIDAWKKLIYDDYPNDDLEVSVKYRRLLLQENLELAYLIALEQKDSVLMGLVADVTQNSELERLAGSFSSGNYRGTNVYEKLKVSRIEGARSSRPLVNRVGEEPSPYQEVAMMQRERASAELD